MRATVVTFALAALVSLSALALAGWQQSSAPPVKITAEQQAMMDALQKAAAVGPNHKLLQPLVGEWSYAMKAWTDPAAKPDEGSGNSSFRSLMDGRFVQHDYQGTFLGTPYHGTGLLGYNNVTKQFEEHFFENVKSSQLLMHGSYDAARRLFTFREIDNVANPRTKVKVRETMRLTDPNTLSLEWYETRLGTELKTMEVTYTRKK